MPVTKGAGNPDWSWDETLLALDLLYRCGKPADRRDKNVIELSELLRSADIFPESVRKDNFRNPDGVSLKLQNLLAAMEPGHRISFSKRDRAAVEAFPKDSRGELAVIVAGIRDAISQGVAADQNIPDDEIFIEGELVSSLHRKRERRLRKKLLEAKTDEDLLCEICKYGPPEHLSRTLRESFFEAHHVKPLSETIGVQKTKLSEMSLLCACCHRYIHCLIRTQKKWISIEDAKEQLKI